MREQVKSRLGVFLTRVQADRILDAHGGSDSSWEEQREYEVLFESGSTGDCLTDSLFDWLGY